MTGKGTPDPQGWADGKIRTRKTNPLYCGSYTIEDYKRDNEARLFKPETTEFQRFLFAGVKAVDPEEGERFDRLYGEALKAYDGPTKWEHGYRLNDITPCNYATSWIYYSDYYELTDAQATEEIKKKLERNRDLLSFADEVHPLLLEAVENSDWLQILEETHQVIAELKPESEAEDTFQAPTAEQVTRTIIWHYLRMYLRSLEDSQTSTLENPPDPKLAAKECLQYELRFRRNVLETKRKSLEARNDAREMLGELEADGYGLLIEHVRESYTEERAWRFKALNIEIYTLYIVAEYKALAGSPPETITADTEAVIEEACRKVEENTNKPITLTLEGQREDIEDPTENMQILQDVDLSRNPDTFSMPANVYMFTLGKRLGGHQTTFDEFVKQVANEINIEIRATKNDDDGEWIRSNLIIPPNVEKPTFGEIMFIEQIGAEWEKAQRDGKNLTYTEKQLIKIRYGIGRDKKSISDKTRAEFRTRLRELSNVRVLIPERTRGIRIAPDKEGEAKEIGTIIGKEERLIEPEIRLVWNSNEQEQTTTIYTILVKPPTRFINKWFGENAEINRDLLLTKAIPADKLSPKARKFYDRDNLRKDKRAKDQLALEDVTYSDLKVCILHTLTYAFHFKQKGSTCIILNLEDVYRLTYPAEKVPSMSNTKWKTYTKTVYTYLTFLIEKGCIEGYDKGQDRGKDSRTTFVYLQEGNTMLYPPRQETAEGSKKKRTRAGSKK